MAATLPDISLESGESMLAKGPEELNRFMVGTLEPAIASEMPQLEVRYKNLSVTADITITEGVTEKSELPTLFNAVAKTFARRDEWCARRSSRTPVACSRRGRSLWS
ncbi:hypothetical protein V7S43_011723 [Phytophthora oleae]|uniref:Uncharacterized protein n=1 Tax=Phytophthora oleae TaxID=2107226 RepID=A0ABD3F8X7_9STRA